MKSSLGYVSLYQCSLKMYIFLFSMEEGACKSAQGPQKMRCSLRTLN